MDTIVIKFGGSSVGDSKKLNTVAKKIIKIYEKTDNVVVVVSAPKTMTDNLIKQGEELSLKPDLREMDMLISAGEQITSAKLSILLNYLGYEAISLTGWQAGIYTNDKNQNATIERINSTRIKQELRKNKIVVVAGFQGIDKNNNITTLQGGSDTTAIALVEELEANKLIKI